MDQAELLSQLRNLLSQGEAACLNGHRAGAEELLERWLNFDVETGSELDRLGHQLWDLLDPVEPVEETWPTLEDVPGIFSRAKDLLERHWGQLGPDGDEELNGRANGAWTELGLVMQAFRYADPEEGKWLLVKGFSWEQWAEAETLHIALEQHIDPEGVMLHARFESIAREGGKSNPIPQTPSVLEPVEQFRARLELIYRGTPFPLQPITYLGKTWQPTDYLAYKTGAWDPSEGLNQLMDEIEELGPNAPSSEQLENTHQAIKEMVEGGASEAEVQQFINGKGEFNQTGLAKYADNCRIELERQQDLADALEDLLLRGAPPVIDLADYVPADWLPMFRVLREGMKFTDEAIVMTIAAGVAAMFPPKVRIKGWSMEEIPTIWVFHIGTSGSAKSVLLRRLITGPMVKPIAAVDAINKRDKTARANTAPEGQGEELPPFRKRNLIYTAPTTQGIRADLAMHGMEIPGLLVRDELNGWLKQMGDEAGAGVGDVEFWLSSYDGAYSNDVFADSRKSREVRDGKLGVIGGIQPKVFLEQLEAGNANGFNSRPLFVHLPRLKRSLMKDDEQTERLVDTLGDLYLAALELGNERFVLSKEAEELFEQLFNQLEDLSMQAGSEEIEALWAKGPGQVLRMAAAIHFLRVTTQQEEELERGWGAMAIVVSARSLQLAANLVMAGKTRAVELHERAANPMLAKADKLMDQARKLQGKSPTKGARLAEIRKRAFDSDHRPTLIELKQLATMLQSRGLVQLLEGGKSIRVIR